MKSSTIIKKASGELVPFLESKLEDSLSRAGANEFEINTILDEVKRQLVNGITTKQIYNIAFEMLRKQPSSIAAKYHLKHAIMQLGPSGFPFEKFFSEILKHNGFKTDVGVILSGHCVNHEIDIVAEKDNKHFMIECKFHNQPGYMCDVKIPLYIQSRFKDVEDKCRNSFNQLVKFDQGWVVTNTKFSSDAIKYGECMGLNLVGWDYPHKLSLRERIDREGLYPLTCLTTLTQKEKIILLEMGIVLSKELCANPSILSKAGISKNRLENILLECRDICKNIIILH